MNQLEEQVSVAPEMLKAEGVERLRGAQGRQMIEKLKEIGVIVIWKEDSPPVLHVTVIEERSPRIAQLKLRTARVIIEGFLTDKCAFERLVIDVFGALRLIMSEDFLAKIDHILEMNSQMMDTILKGQQDSPLNTTSEKKIG